MLITFNKHDSVIDVNEENSTRSRLAATFNNSSKVTDGHCLGMDTSFFNFNAGHVKVGKVKYSSWNVMQVCSSCKRSGDKKNNSG